MGNFAAVTYCTVHTHTHTHTHNCSVPQCTSPPPVPSDRPAAPPPPNPPTSPPVGGAEVKSASQCFCQYLNTVFYYFSSNCLQSNNIINNNFKDGQHFLSLVSYVQYNLFFSSYLIGFLRPHETMTVDETLLYFSWQVFRAKQKVVILPCLVFFRILTAPLLI